MARKKIERLRDDVIAAAREWRGYLYDGSINEIPLADAVAALDAHCIGIADSPGSFVKGSPETSKAAALMASPIQGSTRRKVVDELYAVHGRISIGLTDAELETRLRLPHQTVSSARNWLMGAGWCRDSGQRRLSPAKRERIIWVLTDAALNKIATTRTSQGEP